MVMKFLATTLVYRLNHHARRFARASEPVAPSAGVDALPALTRGAVTRAFTSEATRELADALADLPQKDREVVVLRALEGRSNAEVANLVGDSPNAVSLRYNRVLRLLAERLPGSLLDDLGD